MIEILLSPIIIAISRLLNHLKEIPRLKIRSYLSIEYFWENFPINPTINISAVNISKAPINITMMGVQFENGTNEYFKENLPKKLLEGDIFEYSKDFKTFIEEMMTHKSKLTFLWFEDSAGRIYKHYLKE